MANRLAHESSPYLLQHAQNPVDWYPWGEEALGRARAEDRPIFLSIGYSACHWCHVMEHESFESEAIAALMNELFVCVKVDREERPDLDHIYMTAVQAMTGRGGWPMSVFLTPDLKPFYGGTYWPPTARGGMPGFDQVLRAVAEAWQLRKTQAQERADALAAHVQELCQGSTDRELVMSEQLLRNAALVLRQIYDPRDGGFGQAPKFPHPMDLRLLLRLAARYSEPQLLRMAEHTLERMASGGIYDQLGGGFHRYSVDAQWLVPHFEKMLYDNALLVPCYLELFQVTGQPRYAQIARAVCDYVLNEMTDSAGGFFSTQDADSEGEEGKYFVWTRAEIDELLGSERAQTFAAVYDVTAEGNFEHANILHLARPIADWARQWNRPLADLEAELAASRQVLLAARARRHPPATDDKVLVSWNGLMIQALAQAALVLAEPAYLAAAKNAAEFLLHHLRSENGRLLHTYRQGNAKLPAYLDDYAALALGLTTLYEVSGQTPYLSAAIELAEQMQSHFHDPAGGFFFTADDQETLFARHKDVVDNATPCGNGLAAEVFLTLGKLLGRGDFLNEAERTLQALAPILDRSPTAGGQALLVYDELLGPTRELLLVLPGDAPELPTLLARLHVLWRPRQVLAVVQRAEVSPSHPLAERLANLPPSDEPLLMICEQQTCQPPIFGWAAIEAAVASLAENGASR